MTVGILGPNLGGASEGKLEECVGDTADEVPVEMSDEVVEENVSIEQLLWSAGDIAALAIRLASEIRDLKIRLDEKGDLLEAGVDLDKIEALFGHLFLAMRYAEMGMNNLEEMVAPEV